MSENNSIGSRLASTGLSTALYLYDEFNLALRSVDDRLSKPVVSLPPGFSDVSSDGTDAGWSADDAQQLAASIKGSSQTRLLARPTDAPLTVVELSGDFSPTRLEDFVPNAAYPDVSVSIIGIAGGSPGLNIAAIPGTVITSAELSDI